MKLRKILAALLAVMLAFSLVTTASAGRSPTNWAVSEMENANMCGLLTHNVMKDYQRYLTREEFCEMVVRMTEKTLGRTLTLPAYNKFTDTDAEYVLKACQYGIINGVSDTLFRPDQELKRQEVAAMMIRAMELMQSEMYTTLLLPPAGTLPFTDTNQIDSYAVSYMKYAYSNGIINGNTSGTVTPKASITAEQCAAVIVRTFDAMQDKVCAPLSAYQKLTRAVNNLTIGYAYGDIPTAVSHDLLLPTSAPGGVYIAWYSSDSTVISSTGRVNAPQYPRNVTLTATLTCGGYSQSKQFELTTSSLTGDSLLYQNALDALTIGFWKNTDTLDVVTSNLFLPRTSLGLNVTWTSSRTDVVTTTGRVTPPTNSSIISVTLTATVGGRTKTFLLKVQNPQYQANITLHGVSIGMTEQQVANVLGGTTRNTIWTSNYEAWRLYYSNNYATFIAVIFVNQKVAGVYTMASNWAQQLRDAATSNNAVIKAEEVNSASGVAVKVFTDAATSPKQYAALMYDTESDVMSPRSMIATAAEELTLILINAYRTLNTSSATPLVAVSQLTSLARNYSNTCYTYNGTAPTTSISQRVANEGYEYSLFLGELPQSDGAGPQDVLYDLVRYTQSRAALVQTTATVIGIGYAGNSARSYTTIELGSLITLTGATVTGNAISVNLGATVNNITVTLQPANNANREPVQIYASNSYITVSADTGYSLNVPRGTYSTKITVRGNTTGQTAYVIVKGTISGQTYQIPVTVGSAYASAVSFDGITGAKTSYMIEANSQVQIKATATPVSGSSGTPTITWSLVGSNISGASINSSGQLSLINGYSGSQTFYVRATVQKNANETIYKDVPVVVVNTNIVQNSTSTIYTPAAGTTNSYTIPQFSYNSITATSTGSVTGTSSNYVTVSGNTVTAKAITGTQTATVSVNVTHPTFVNTIPKTIYVKVEGQAAQPNSVNILHSDGTTVDSPLTMVVGEEMTFTAALPTGYNISDFNVVWSLDNNCASPNGNGGAFGVTETITAMTAGTVKLTATVQGTTTTVARSVTITILPTPTVSINADASINIIESTTDTTKQAIATLSAPAPANCRFEWTSDYPFLVTVAANGMLTIQAPRYDDLATKSLDVEIKVDVYKGNMWLCSATKTITINILQATPSP